MTLHRYSKLSLTFLGTASGSGPSLGRSCTATALTLPWSKQWLIDCSEGTLRQHRQASSRRIVGGLNGVERVFITHLHADHCMGILPFMKARLPWWAALNPPEPASASSSPTASSPSSTSSLHLYGPKGLREFVRFLLKATYTTLGGEYAVHELLRRDEKPTSCGEEERHPNEGVGEDVYPGEDGLWRGIVRERREVEIEVDAGPLVHRAPCVGYVFSVRPPDREHSPPVDGPPIGKLVVLGDTSDSSGMIPLAMNADAVVHEGTCMVPPTIATDSKEKLSHAAVSEMLEDPSKLYDLDPEAEARAREKAVAKGHSTARMAGEFAVKVNAKELYLNHLTFRVHDPVWTDDRWRGGEVPARATNALAALACLRHQAEAADPSGRLRAVVARDFGHVDFDFEHPTSNE